MVELDARRAEHVEGAASWIAEWVSGQHLRLDYELVEGAGQRSAPRRTEKLIAGL